jgi:hypothetical protein
MTVGSRREGSPGRSHQPRRRFGREARRSFIRRYCIIAAADRRADKRLAAYLSPTGAGELCAGAASAQIPGHRSMHALWLPLRLRVTAVVISPTVIRSHSSSATRSTPRRWPNRRPGPRRECRRLRRERRTARRGRSGSSSRTGISSPDASLVNVPISAANRGSEPARPSLIESRDRCSHASGLITAPSIVWPRSPGLARPGPMEAPRKARGMTAGSTQRPRSLFRPPPACATPHHAETGRSHQPGSRHPRLYASLIARRVQDTSPGPRHLQLPPRPPARHAHWPLRRAPRRGAGRSRPPSGM